MSNSEYVLVRPQRQRGRAIYHVPDADGNPRCGTELRAEDSRFKQLRREHVGGRWRLCALCDPDHDVEKSHPGEHLATRLRHADPDDVGRRV